MMKMKLTCSIIIFVLMVVETQAHGWCSQGEYWDTDGCKPCPEDHYNDKPGNNTSCSRCTVCQPGTHQNMVTDCSATRDRLCHCPNGTFWEIIHGHDGSCFPHEKCEGTTLVQGTPWKDAVCGDFINHTTDVQMTTSTYSIPGTVTTPSAVTNLPTSITTTVTSNTTIPVNNNSESDNAERLWGLTIAVTVLTTAVITVPVTLIIVFIVYRIIKNKQRLRGIPGEGVKFYSTPGRVENKIEMLSVKEDVEVVDEDNGERSKLK